MVYRQALSRVSSSLGSFLDRLTYIFADEDTKATMLVDRVSVALRDDDVTGVEQAVRLMNELVHNAQHSPKLGDILDQADKMSVMVYVAEDRVLEGNGRDAVDACEFLDEAIEGLRESRGLRRSPPTVTTET